MGARPTLAGTFHAVPPAPRENLLLLLRSCASFIARVYPAIFVSARHDSRRDPARPRPALALLASAPNSRGTRSQRLVLVGAPSYGST